MMDDDDGWRYYLVLSVECSSDGYTAVSFPTTSSSQASQLVYVTHDMILNYGSDTHRTDAC